MAVDVGDPVLSGRFAMITSPRKPPFQFGLGALFAIITVAIVLMMSPKPVRMFWRESVWNGSRSPQTGHAGEFVVGILLALLFCAGVAVGAMLRKR
jgi:hypothetical protein